MESLSARHYDDPYQHKGYTPEAYRAPDFDVDIAPESEVTAIRPIPFHAVASDFDGVVTLYGKETEEEADRIRELFIEKTLAKGIPLSFITGKDEKDVIPQIIEPIRKKLKEMNIDLPAGKFMVLANNGSVIIDAGLQDHVKERKTFKDEDLEKVGDVEVVQIMMDIYDIFEDIRSRIPDAYKESRFREEETTLGFSLNPEDLKSPHVHHLTTKLQQLAGTNKDLTRFDIGQIFKEQLEAAGLDHFKIAVTDGAVDLTPPGTGKRKALEWFSEKQGIAIENILRIGDNPAGSDFPLLAPKEGERRGGYANVKIEEDKVAILQAQNNGFGTPYEIEAPGNQFQRTIALLEEVHTTPWTGA